jgi:hypothetical protein
LNTVNATSVHSQELHAANTGGQLQLTAADLSAAAAGLASSLSRLDISRHTDSAMAGSVKTLAQLTALRHLDAYGSRIAAADGAVCEHLTQLSQLTFLSVGSVHRTIMVIGAEDAGQLSVLTGLRQLQLQGAKLGSDGYPMTEQQYNLGWLSSLKQLTELRGAVLLAGALFDWCCCHISCLRQAPDTSQQLPSLYRILPCC